MGKITVTGQGDVAGYSREYPNTAAGEAAAQRSVDRFTAAGHRVRMTVSAGGGNIADSDGNTCGER